jgi:hypothetical protein
MSWAQSAVPAAQTTTDATRERLSVLLTAAPDTPLGASVTAAVLSAARTAVQQARAAEQVPTDLATMQAAAQHVLRALDPSLVKDDLGTAYGVRPGVTAIIEQLAALRSADPQPDVARLAADALAAARNVAGWCDQAIADAQRIAAATTADDAASSARALSIVTRQLLVGALSAGAPHALSSASTGGLFFIQMRLTMLKAGRDAVAAHPGTVAAVAARPTTTAAPTVPTTAAPPTAAKTPPVALPLLPAGKPGTLPVTRVEGAAR